MVAVSFQEFCLFFFGQPNLSTSTEQNDALQVRSVGFMDFLHSLISLFIVSALPSLTLSIFLSVCVSTSLSVSQSLSLSLCLFFSVCISTSQSVSLVFLCFCLSVLSAPFSLLSPHFFAFCLSISFFLSSLFILSHRNFFLLWLFCHCASFLFMQTISHRCNRDTVS